MHTSGSPRSAHSRCTCIHRGPRGSHAAVTSPHPRTRAPFARRLATGRSRPRVCELIEELAGPWLAQQESRLRERRGHARLRAEGAGPAHELPFADRVIATLVVLRFQLPHAALALFYQVDRSTITPAVHEIRPLLAAPGFAVPRAPGPRRPPLPAA